MWSRQEEICMTGLTGLSDLPLLRVANGNLVLISCLTGCLVISLNYIEIEMKMNTQNDKLYNNKTPEQQNTALLFFYNSQ